MAWHDWWHLVRRLRNWRGIFLRKGSTLVPRAGSEDFSIRYDISRRVSKRRRKPFQPYPGLSGSGCRGHDRCQLENSCWPGSARSVADTPPSE